MINISHLTKVYGPRIVLDKVSLSINKGEIHGFLGPNGAGKSTTMKIISGILAPTSGEVEIDGLKLSTDLFKIKSKIGILPETPPLYLDMKVKDYLNFALELRGIKVDREKKLNFALEKTGTENIKNRLIGNLSRGFKQRVGVASAIVFNPDLIILDEPTVGLDPASIHEMRSLIKSLGKDHTIILSSHLLHEVSLSCSHISIINQGKLITTGPLKEIEKKFKTKKIIILITQKEPVDLPKKLKETGVFDHLEVTKKEEGFETKVFLSSNTDLRSQISELAVELKLGLLSIHEEEKDLEDIFLNLTGGEKS